MNLLSSTTVQAEPLMRITDFQYTLLRQYEQGAFYITEYNFSIIVENSGTSTSPLMELLIVDDEKPDPFTIKHDNFTLIPGEQEIIHTQWTGVRYRDYVVNMTLQPMLLDPKYYSDANTDFQSYIIDITGSTNEEQTPGFTFYMTLLIILFSVIMIKRRKKK